MEELRQLVHQAGRRSPEALARLEHHYDIELTYTSNAIEGNTLSAVETTLIIEKGIAVGGKPLSDRLEALDHYDAIRYVRELDGMKRPSPKVTFAIFTAWSCKGPPRRLLVSTRFLRVRVPTETGRHTFPSPPEIPALMNDFARWLVSAGNAPDVAFAAHMRLVDIHPFNDGNGRTARLLMNLILIRSGYPPIAVRPEDRPEYIRALHQEQSGQGTNASGESQHCSRSHTGLLTIHDSIRCQ